jgi:hypothetical protein
MTEILLKVVLNTINLTLTSGYSKYLAMYKKMYMLIVNDFVLIHKKDHVKMITMI